jgi:hypothetical protein
MLNDPRGVTTRPDVEIADRLPAPAIAPRHLDVRDATACFRYVTSAVA